MLTRSVTKYAAAVIIAGILLLSAVSIYNDNEVTQSSTEKRTYRSTLISKCLGPHIDSIEPSNSDLQKQQGFELKERLRSARSSFRMTMGSQLGLNDIYVFEFESTATATRAMRDIPKSAWAREQDGELLFIHQGEISPIQQTLFDQCTKKVRRES